MNLDDLWEKFFNVFQTDPQRYFVHRWKVDTFYDHKTKIPRLPEPNVLDDMIK